MYRSENLEDQLDIHDWALELRTRGLSYSKIIAQISCEFNVGLPKSTVSYWVRRLHCPQGRAYVFRSSPTPELAYIIGVVAGDGSLSVRQKQYDYRIRLQSIDREFVEEFDRCLSNVLNSSKHAFWKGAGRNEIHVDVGGYLLHHFLQQPLQLLKPSIGHDRECSAGFLRGFFDSEGCVDKSGSLTASNTDEFLLRYVQYLLAKDFGIDTTGPHLQTRKGSEIKRRGRTYRRNSDCMTIRVRNKFRLQFVEEIGMTIRRKNSKLRGILQKNRRR